MECENVKLFLRESLGLRSQSEAVKSSVAAAGTDIVFLSVQGCAPFDDMNAGCTSGLVHRGNPVIHRIHIHIAHIRHTPVRRRKRRGAAAKGITRSRSAVARDAFTRATSLTTATGRARLAFGAAMGAADAAMTCSGFVYAATSAAVGAHSGHTAGVETAWSEHPSHSAIPDGHRNRRSTPRPRVTAVRATIGGGTIRGRPIFASGRSTI